MKTTPRIFAKCFTVKVSAIFFSGQGEMGFEPSTMEWWWKCSTSNFYLLCPCSKFCQRNKQIQCWIDKMHEAVLRISI